MQQSCNRKTDKKTKKKIAHAIVLTTQFKIHERERDNYLSRNVFLTTGVFLFWRFVQI